MGGGPDNEEEFVILNKVSAAELEEIDKSKAANTENAFEEAKQRKNLHFSDGISKKSEAGCAIDEKKKKEEDEDSIISEALYETEKEYNRANKNKEGQDSNSNHTCGTNKSGDNGKDFSFLNDIFKNLFQVVNCNSYEKENDFITPNIFKTINFINQAVRKADTNNGDSKVFDFCYRNQSKRTQNKYANLENDGDFFSLLKIFARVFQHRHNFEAIQEFISKSYVIDFFVEICKSLSNDDSKIPEIIVMVLKHSNLTKILNDVGSMFQKAPGLIDLFPVFIRIVTVFLSNIKKNKNSCPFDSNECKLDPMLFENLLDSTLHVFKNCKRSNDTNQNKCNKKTQSKSYRKEDKDISCAKGHSLIKFIAPHSDFICDSCDTNLRFNAPLAGCRLCNFDLCMVCVDAQKMNHLNTNTSCPNTNDVNSDVTKNSDSKDSSNINSNTIASSPTSLAKNGDDFLKPTKETAISNQKSIQQNSDGNPPHNSTALNKITTAVKENDKGIASKPPIFKFVSDVTFSDGSAVEPEKEIKKIWRISNQSSIISPKGIFKLINTSKKSFVKDIYIPSLIPNDTYDIEITFTTPTEPGQHVERFHLANLNGEKIGDDLWYDVNVVHTSLPVKQEKVPHLEQLNLLEELGFKNTKLNQTLLRDLEGNLEETISTLLHHQKNNF